MRHLFRVVVAVVLVAGCASSAGPASAHQRSSAQAADLPGLWVGTAANAFPVRPAVIGGWTNDGTGFVGGPHPIPVSGKGFGKIRWLRWTSRRAAGRGVVWGNDCDPDCADGSWHHDRLTRVVVWRPRHGHFTRLRFSYDPGNGRHAVTFKYHAYGPQTWW